MSAKIPTSSIVDSEQEIPYICFLISYGKLVFFGKIDTPIQSLNQFRSI